MPGGSAAMDSVTSTEGTRIAFARSGEGPTLVLVHGTAADHTGWTPVLPELSARFTVLALDRRGRGSSDDGDAYSLASEAADVAAVAATSPAPVFLLGHSYGALCALEASLLTDRVSRLLLYEPPFPAGEPLVSPSLAQGMDALLAEGNRIEVLETFLRQVLQMSKAELKALQARPDWPARVAAAHTVPREARAADAYVLDPGRFAAMRVPVLLLRGSGSHKLLGAATEALHRALPSSRVAVLPGQKHHAVTSAPDLFLREVLAFFSQPDTSP